MIFHGVLINPGAVIEKIPLPPISASLDTNPGDITIAENERNYILRVLEKCSWKVGGSDGAASILDLKISTLFSRMKKLGIKRPETK